MSWQLPAFVLLSAVLAAGFLWYERRQPPARVLSLVAALAALAVVGRLAFAAFPNVKPTTDIVLFAGYALGAVPGFAVGAVTALVSNVFLGQGPWTPWQMAAWAGVGMGGALLAHAMHGRELSRWWLALACGAAGLAFGAFMDVYQWTLTARQDLDSYVAVSASSLPYKAAHAIGNVIFCLVIGPAFVRALRRYRRRFEVRWAPAAAAALAALGVAATLLAAPGVEAASPSGRAAAYLERAQNRDGGFAGAPRQSSNQLMTGWTALGLASAGRNPQDVRRAGGKSVTTYIRRRLGALKDVGELERTILVLRAAGLSARRFGGRDLVAELLRRRDADASWNRNVAHTAFGVMALRAAGDGEIERSARWIDAAQNADGGFGYTPQAASDADNTGAALEALAAAGRGGEGVRRAVAFLLERQNGDGGFPLARGQLSNAQSTAWAVQGLVAVRAGGAAVDRAVRYLTSLQRRDGSVRYSRGSGQTPVWVTAQALAAMRRKAFPLRPARRKRAKRRRSTRAAAATRKRRRKPARPRARASSENRTGRALAEVDLRAARATTPVSDEERDSVALPVLAGAAGATLLAVWLLRRRLRRRARPD